MDNPKNVLGETLKLCGDFPKTGYLRTGTCEARPQDQGSHDICAQVTEAFLAFTKRMGKDSSSPAPQLGFPGLKPGDRWCLCALRWKEALDTGLAPPVFLEARHESARRYVSMEALKDHALDSV
jgi:uncharacterized protein (DUF2237 family)